MKRWIRSRYIPGLPIDGRKERITGSDEHIQLSLQAAEEGMVLLKNNNNVLPLQQGTKAALFGKGTFDYVKGGGGSGDVTVAYIRNLYEGLKLTGAVECFEGTAEYYKNYVENCYAEGDVPGMVIEPELPEALLKEAREYTDTAIITISRFSGEGWDRKAGDEKIELPGEGSDMLAAVEKVFARGDFYLTDAEEKMAKAVAAAFPKVIVVLNVGGVVDTEWFKDNDEVDSVLLAFQGGMEGGLAAAELLIGKSNPSGKLSDTFAKELTDYPSTENFHESITYVEYTEDIYVGYRYFETIPGMKERVNYPFGYGLSYTTFEIGAADVVIDGKAVKISVPVKNTGAYAGKEVVQVYAAGKPGKLGRPAKVLVGYKKTGLLEAGASETVEISLSLDQLASYDDLGKIVKSAWIIEAGEYAFEIGNSVRNTVPAAVVYTQAEDEVIEQCSEKLAPKQLKKRLLCDGSYEELEQREPINTYENIMEPLEQGSDIYLLPEVRYEAHRAPEWKTNASKIVLDDVADGKNTMEEFMAQFTVEDLAHLLGGQPNTGVANTWGMGNMSEYGIPNMMTADGPAGLRIRPEVGVNTTAFPCSTMLACTWNPEIVEAIGVAGGQEVRENNIAIWLTPAVNIHRSPLCGRNFEYYSEDPFLAGKQAAAMVRGIQSQGVACSVKHFALNNKETNRKDSDSRCSERAIREIYLKQFEIIVKEADPWTIMSSYNVVNGVHTSESKELLTDILRGEWGFKGMVTTDWWTYGEHYKETRAGNDLKMATGFVDRLMVAYEAGELTREEMEICVKRILETILKLENI